MTTSQEKFYGVSEAARLMNSKPRDLTNLFYNRQLRDDLCPLVSGRRVIPESYLKNIAMELRRGGKMVDYEGIKGGSNE